MKLPNNVSARLIKKALLLVFYFSCTEGARSKTQHNVAGVRETRISMEWDVFAVLQRELAVGGKNG